MVMLIALSLCYQTTTTTTTKKILAMTQYATYTINLQKRNWTDLGLEGLRESPWYAGETDSKISFTVPANVSKGQAKKAIENFWYEDQKQWANEAEQGATPHYECKKISSGVVEVYEYRGFKFSARGSNGSYVDVKGNRNTSYRSYEFNGRTFYKLNDVKAVIDAIV